MAEPTSVSPPLPAAESGGRDLGALERTLKRIAATTELTPDQRRKAMLVVLRTWEDPSRNESANQLIDVLLREETGLPVMVCENPQLAVVLGTGKVLDELGLLREIALR